MPLQKIVETILLPNPLVFPLETPVLEAMKAMRETRGSCVLVMEGQQLRGILTERDIVRAASYQTPLHDLRVVDLMSPEVITLKASEIKTIFQLTQLLGQHHIRHLPILDAQDQVLGIVTPGSIRQRLRPEYLLRYVKAKEVMTAKVVTATADLTLLEITQRMMLHRVSCVVITGDRPTEPIGIITERDIVQFSSMGLDFEQAAAMVMSTPLSTVQSQDSLWLVHQRMTQLRVRRLVVTDAEGSLAGIITQTQVLKMCDPKELHYVMRTMQLVIDRQKQELQQLNRSLEAKNAELNSLVNVDELTKVANRRQFNTSLQQEWQRLQKEQQPLSIILGDIDNFKKFNDTYGHLSGDRCLQEIAQLLVKAARCPQDLVARFGGEEFIMILPETDAAGAETMAKTILRKIYQLQIPHATSTNGDHVSMSLGVATTMPSPERSVQDFLETVDRLLYRSKHLGGGTYSLEKLW